LTRAASLRIASIIACLALAACTQKVSGLGKAAGFDLVKTAYGDLPGWHDDTQKEAIPAVLRTCAVINKQPMQRHLGASKIGGRTSDWRPICTAASRLQDTNGAAIKFFETWFDPYLVSVEDNQEGLFTGYYEASLRGSLSQKGSYWVPIHGLPPGIITADLSRFNSKWDDQQLSGKVIGGKLVPIETRAEIQAGALSGQNLELLWVDDLVDAFFLHIQGSGRVLLEDGRTVRLGFAGRNGHAYRSIGKNLIERGEIAAENMSMQSLRAWLYENSLEGAELMKKNRSYIFFRVLKGDGPIGALGAVLTPGRSLAVDPSFISLGLPVWLDTTEPGQMDEKPLRRLVIAQDSGSAIKGVVRGDLFWGHGKTAAWKAGMMKQSGRYYVLLPKSATPE
jgi:membrane-bound lytic murein transglycosylase A